MTTRDKLAVAIRAAREGYPDHALDALEAIVAEARDEALNDAENACEGVYSFFGCRGDSAEGASRCVLEIRALKKEKP